MRVLKIIEIIVNHFQIVHYDYHLVQLLKQNYMAVQANDLYKHKLDISGLKIVENKNKIKDERRKE